MASVCFYFQVHQPFRLRRYSVFDNDPFYFDNDANREIMLKVANKCYRPATKKILDLVKRHEGRFRVSFAISGVCLEQFELWAPDVLDMFKELADTGACEFIGETSHHSLSFLFARDEFDRQVDNHREKVRELFGQTPRIFRNTELTYHDDLAWHMTQRGEHEAILCTVMGDRPHESNVVGCFRMFANSCNASGGRFNAEHQRAAAMSSLIGIVFSRNIE